MFREYFNTGGEEYEKDFYMYYPVLENNIDRKSQSDAANLLINFVQTAFIYQIEEEQFGYERSLWGDETIYYPASDCEDRSILFSILVRELLSLDVVLLHYPGHLVSAVRFSEDIEGDYLWSETTLNRVHLTLTKIGRWFKLL